ncbi:unnamed protein product [Camellia sinensis]
MMEDGDHTGVDSEEEPLEHIIEHEKSAAGILCLLKTCHGNEAANLLLTKDVLGIVATLGKVDDDNLSRLLSEYLGIETMLAVVCKTYDGVKALETYGNDGSVSKSSGLHGLGTSIGRHLDGHFQVICLENMRPFHGEFVAEDPQMQLDLFKPRLYCKYIYIYFLYGFIKLFVASVADRMCRFGAVDLICVDAVSALTPRAEIEMGLQACLMSQAPCKMSGNASKAGCTRIFLNQIRHKVILINKV